VFFLRDRLLRKACMRQVKKQHQYRQPRNALMPQGSTLDRMLPAVEHTHLIATSMRTKSKVSLRRMSMKNGLRIGQVRVMAGRNCRACGERAHPERHLGKFRGTLQAEAYAEFNQLYENGRIKQAPCWAHVRRKFYEPEQARASSVAREAQL
jgi:hypothetical protein